MKIESIMSRDCASCGPDETLDRAAQIMWERDVGIVPVVDEQRRVLGVVTDRDLCMAAYTRGASLRDIRIGEVMTNRDLQTCEPGDDLQTAERRMREHQIRRILVVEHGRLVGILSLNDLALAANQRQRRGEAGPSADEVAETLAAISEHRTNNSSAEAR